MLASGMILALFVSIVLIYSVHSFRVPLQPSRTTSICSTFPRSHNKMVSATQPHKFRTKFGRQLEEVYTKFKNPDSRREMMVITSNTVQSIVSGLTRNIKDGESGKRGEGWMLTVLGIYSMIWLGVPSIFSWLIQFSAIGYTGIGLGMFGSAIWQLKENNSPYIIPSRGNRLVTTGIYEHVRHPMYGGIILTAVGLSVMSNSVEKLLMSAVLVFVLVRICASICGTRQVLAKF